MPKEIAE